MTNFKPQLVHESEVQRQHVRVELPAARAVIRNKTYSARDVSVGGIRLKDVQDKFQKHEKIILELSLPFEAFSLNLNLPCVVEHYDAKDKTLGCAFTTLTDAQMSLLNVVIKSRMAGTIIDAGDILHIAGRNNFVKFNRDANGVALTKPQTIKRNGIMLAFSLLGLLCLALIIGNIYQRVAIISTSNAYVHADTLTVKAPVNGEFQYMLGDSITKLRTGQKIGQIKTYVTENGGHESLMQTSIPVLSPCDCMIINSAIENGEFRIAGEPIITLLPTGQAPWVSARIPTGDAHNITNGQIADIHIFGSNETVKGTIHDIAISAAGNEFIDIKIKPDKVLPLSALKKPAIVEIRLH